MAEIWTMGELLCEIMRPRVDMALDRADAFLGPYPSGAPAIFIDTAARLGHSAGIVGGIGRDDFGKCILDRLSGDGVDCSQIIQYDDGATGVAFVTYFGDGSRRFIYHFPQTPATRPLAPPLEAFGGGGSGGGGSGGGSGSGSDSEGTTVGVRFFHIMGCSLMANKEFGQEIIKLMRTLHDIGVKISFDPNIRPELMKNESIFQMVGEAMEHCNVFLPGVSELLMISGRATVEDAIDACFENKALEIVALKNGAEGCTIYTRGEVISMGAYKVDAKDPTGAGDCFDAAFVCGLLEGMPIKAAARYANAAAALNTMAFGPMEGDISKQNINKLINEHDVYDSGDGTFL